GLNVKSRMSACAIRMCSASWQIEYCQSRGTSAAVLNGTASTAASKVACASFESSRFTSCVRSVRSSMTRPRRRLLRQIGEQSARRLRVVAMHPELDRAGDRAGADRPLQAFVLGEALYPFALEQRFSDRDDRDVDRLEHAHELRTAAAGHRPRYSTRIKSERVLMKVLSVLKSRTSTAGFCGVIIVDSRSTGVDTSTKGKAGCMIVSTGCAFTAGWRTSSS